MTYTNLEYVQTILSSMDSDQVNSISDTTEALQVLAVLKTCYFDLVSTGELPRDDGLFQLQASNDPLKPVQMALPDDINDIRWLKYDYQTVANPNPNFQIMKPMELIDFIEMVTNLNPDDVNVTTWTYTNSKSETFTLYCRNDVPPQYYTATDDRAVLFDAYDNTVDTTLQQSKTMLFGQKKYDWQDTDTFVTPLDHKQSQRLLHMAKSLAFAELKQTPHASADRAARIIQIDQQASKHKVLHNNYQNTTYSFGRRPMGRTKPTGRYK